MGFFLLNKYESENVKSVEVKNIIERPWCDYNEWHLNAWSATGCANCAQILLP
jgi:hypothetical protein